MLKYLFVCVCVGGGGGGGGGAVVSIHWIGTFQVILE